MRRTSIAMVAAVTCLTAVSGSAHAAAPSESRRASCAQAWALVATERSGLAADDSGAWTRVSDGFLSMSDASFVGPVSNALGYVSQAAADIVGALSTDPPGASSRRSFDSALGDLGTACARLTVTDHRLSVPQFQRFRYETATINGLSPSAATRANAAVEAIVERAVRSARHADGSPCTDGVRACGYFNQTLRQRPCVSGAVCIRQQTGLLPVGANDGADTIATFALDALTGRGLPLSRFVPASATSQFLVDLNAKVQEKLARGGLADDPYWSRELALNDVRAWTPEPDGLHVWFAKFAVAPGSFGIVHVLVPWRVPTT